VRLSNQLCATTSGGGCTTRVRIARMSDPPITTMASGFCVCEPMPFDSAQYAVVEYTIAGEQLGPIGWVPAQKDAVIRLHLVDVNELRDGRIARIWRYDNPAETMTPGP
jgi:hypothetical protein